MRTWGCRGGFGPSRWVVLLGGVVFGLAGCGQSSVSRPPGDPPAATGPAALSTAADGAPSLGTGQATITGTVEGPQGPVPGATVQIEREVNDNSTRATITSGPGGAWDVPTVPGGSYSVRAWLAPNLVQTSPTTFFLAAQGDHDVTLNLASFSTPLVQAAVAPDPPLTGQLAQVVVQVTSRQVRSDGTVVDQPAAGLSVQLDGHGAWVIRPPNPLTTNGSGQVAWTATCDEAGSQSLHATVGTQPVPLTLSACLAPTTPVPTAPTLTPPPTSTSTTTVPPPAAPTPTAPTPTVPAPTVPAPTATGSGRG